MSMAIRAKNAKERATIAANMIKKNDTFTRCFDNCFEMGDGDEVMNHIIKKARNDIKLAIALKEKMPGLGHGEFNKRMHVAIEECLQREAERRVNSVIQNKELKSKITQLFVHCKCLIKESEHLEKMIDFLRLINVDYQWKLNENKYYEIKVPNEETLKLLLYIK